MNAFSIDEQYRALLKANLAFFESIGKDDEKKCLWNLREEVKANIDLYDEVKK